MNTISLRPLLIGTSVLLLAGTAPGTVFTVKHADDSGQGSLRQAILDANADPSATTGSPHQIHFNIDPGGAPTIVCTSALPAVTRPTRILGATQPGFVADPLITITFSESVPNTTNGLTVSANSCVVDALAINGFGSNAVGVNVSSQTNVIIQRCRIGCDRLAGKIVPTAGASGSSRGIRLSGGGSHLVENCVIAGTTDGIMIEKGSSKNHVRNNHVGVSPAGANLACKLVGIGIIDATTADNVIGPGNVIALNELGVRTFGAATKIIGNTIGFHPGKLSGGGQLYGVLLESSAVGSVVGESGNGNIIGRHDSEGVLVLAKDSLIAFNRVGITASGGNVGNQGAGIRLLGDADGNAVTDNLVFFNGGDGILLEATASGAAGQPDGCPIRRNRCGSNGGLGINLRPIGQPASVVTTNDKDDPDSGPNDLQNFPIITGLSSNGTSTTINGTLNVSAGDAGTYRIDVFRSLSEDPSNHGEGEVYVATTDIPSLGGPGNTNGVWSLTVAGHFPNQWFTATATLDAPGKSRSSEFSRAVLANPGSLAFSPSTLLTLTEGNSVTAGVARAGGSYGPVTVTVNAIPGTASVPGDFTPASHIVSFTDGQTFATSGSFTAVDDTLHEGTEALTWQLASPTGGASLAALGTTRSINILDNDPPPVVSVVAEPGSPPEGVNRKFNVTLSTVSGLPVTVDYASADGTAKAPGDYTPVSGQLVIPAGTQTGSIFVQTIDDEISEFTESIQMTISNPINATLGTASATGFISDNDPLPVFSVTPDQTVSEDVGPVTFIASIDRLSERSPSFTVALIAGTANAADFSGSGFSGPTVFSFAPGVSSRNIVVNITDDALNEDTETFSLRFSNPSHLAPFDPFDRTVTILDNDPLPMVQVLNALGVTEGASIPLAVQVSPISGREVRVDYTTVDGSAVSPGDYIAATGTFVIPPFTQFASVPVVTIDDDVHEATEFLQFRISNPVNATLGPQSTASASIKDNDPAPVLTVTAPGPEVPENAGTIEFLLTLDRPSQLTPRVNFAFTPGTAAHPDDFTGALTGQVVFGDGVISRTVTLDIVQDSLIEGNESFSWQLSNHDSGTLVFSGASGVITIVDDEFPPIALSDVEINEGDPTTPPSFSGKVTWGPVSGIVVAEVSSDLGQTDPWAPFASIELDPTGSAVFTDLPVPLERIGAERLFFRIRVAQTLLDHFDSGGGFSPTENTIAAAGFQELGTIDYIRLGVAFSVPPGPGQRFVSLTLPISFAETFDLGLRVTLQADNAGRPGAIVETLSNGNTWPSFSNPFHTKTTLHSLVFPTLNGGAQYWIVTEPMNAIPAAPSNFGDYRWFRNRSPAKSSTIIQQLSENLPQDPWSGSTRSLNVAFRIESLTQP